MIFSKDIYKNELPSIRMSTPSSLTTFKLINRKKNINNINSKYDVLDSYNYCYEDEAIVKKLFYLREKIDELLDKKISKYKILDSCKVFFKYSLKNTLLQPYKEKCQDLEKSFYKVINILKN